MLTLPIAATVTAQTAAAAAGCKTKLELIKGNPVGISCGPASAKLHYKGKTYSFRSGTCDISKLPAGTVFGLSLGKNSDVNGNAGLVGLTFDFQANGLNAVVRANQGGVYINDGAAAATKFGRTGTIKGTSNGAPYKVSWNCGGPPSKD